MRREDLAKICYLSCVEHYFLAWLSQSLDTGCLCCAAFAEIAEVAEDFLSGAAYERYARIPRVQDTAEVLGLTRHRRMNKIPDCQGEHLTLIQVDPSFWKGHAAPWRQDHYIVLEGAGNSFRYVNQYPLSEGTLRNDQLGEIYGGTTLLFRRTGDLDERAYRRLSEGERGRIQLPPRPAGLHRLSGRKLRDALGVLKVSRTRTLQWLQYEREGSDELAELAEALKKLYLRVEMDLLRGRTVDYGGKLEEIESLEWEWRRKIG